MAGTFADSFAKLYSSAALNTENLRSKVNRETEKSKRAANLAQTLIKVYSKHTDGEGNSGTGGQVPTVRISPLHVCSRCVEICLDRQSLQLSWIFLQLPSCKYRNKQGRLALSHSRVLSQPLFVRFVQQLEKMLWYAAIAAMRALSMGRPGSTGRSPSSHRHWPCILRFTASASCSPP